MKVPLKTFDRTAMVEIPCIVGSNGYENMSRIYSTIPKGINGTTSKCRKAYSRSLIEGSYQNYGTITLSKTVPSARVAKLILDDLIEANKG